MKVFSASYDKSYKYLKKPPGKKGICLYKDCFLYDIVSNFTPVIIFMQTLIISLTDKKNTLTPLKINKLGETFKINLKQGRQQHKS